MTLTMNTAAPAEPITYPARPLNGGPLEKAGPKPGRWHYEPKYNGWRALVHTPSGTMFNRHGKRLSIEAEFRPALDYLQHFHKEWEWLDCEALSRRHNIGRGTLIVLDVVDPEFDYEQRRMLLEAMFPVADIPPQMMPDMGLVIAPSWQSEMAPYMWEELRKFNSGESANWFYEGLVAKKLDSYYPVQFRSDDEKCNGWIKHRYDW